MEIVDRRRPISLRQEQFELGLEVNRLRQQLETLERTQAYNILAQLHSVHRDNGLPTRFGLFFRSPRGARVIQRIAAEVSFANLAREVPGQGDTQAYLALGYNPMTGTGEGGEEFWARYDCILVEPTADHGANVSSGTVHARSKTEIDYFDRTRQRSYTRGNDLPFNVRRAIQEMYARSPAQTGPDAVLQ